jgi:hypothetical protein
MHSFNGCSESVKSFLAFDHFWMPKNFVAKVIRLNLGGSSLLTWHVSPESFLERKVGGCVPKVNRPESMR